jgi:hypothetical protein
MKKYLIFGMLFLLVSCKKEREINFDNSSENDTLVNTTLEEKKFDKINFNDRAEELIYIREYLKYKLPRILIEKEPDIVKKAQYELIANGENPSLLDAAVRTIAFENDYDIYMSLITSEKMSFKEVKSQLESKGKINFKLSDVIFKSNNKDYYQQEKENHELIIEEPLETDSNNDDALKNILNESEPKNDNNYNGQGTGREIEENSFGGRKALIKPNPKYNCNEEGTVVVEIVVDKGGNVINVKTGLKGTTNNSKCLLDACKEAALNTKWEANENAPDKQVGKISYNFRLN